MILLLCSLALAQDTTVELIVSDADVGGQLIAPARGVSIDHVVGQDGASGTPSTHRTFSMRVRRDSDAHSHTLLQASVAATPLDEVTVRAYVPHPVNAGERLVVQEIILSGPAWIHAGSVTLDANLPTGHETLDLSAAALKQVSYTYDDSGTLTGTTSYP